MLRFAAVHIDHPARHRVRVGFRRSVHRSKTEAPRAAGTLIPYLLSSATAERLLKIGFEATVPFVGGNTFAVLSRVFWTKLPSGRLAGRTEGPQRNRVWAARTTRC